ncbi:MAG: hypothetical protein QG622_2959 [Actinomycetota bacterium]|nr:hypothetical protein [Actinomycetota bacterium]
MWIRMPDRVRVGKGGARRSGQVTPGAPFMEIYTDPASGRQYTVDPATGLSRWLDQPPPPNLQDTQELPVPPGGGYGGHEPDPGWYPEVPPEQSRRMGRAGGVAMRVLAVLLVLCVLGTALVLVLGRGGDTPSQPTRPTPSRTVAPPSQKPATRPTPRPAPPVPGVGTPVRDGKFEFTVTGIARKKRLGNEFVNTTSDGTFLLVTVTVRNISDKNKTFLSLAQKLHDTAGRQFTADPAAAIFLGAPSNLVDQIDPGTSVTGTLVFDVPVDSTPDRVVLHDSVLSGGVEVDLR